MLFFEFLLPVLYWFLALGIALTVWVIDRRARRLEQEQDRPAPTIRRVARSRREETLPRAPLANDAASKE